MEFRILGVLEVVDNGRPVHIGASKERALLAELVLHPNQIVSRERLMEVVWGESAPATATATLNTYVCHLRAALEPGRERRSSPRLLLTREPGYLLAVDPERVDGVRFERLAAEGSRALSAGDPDAAAVTLRTALALWRGEALADFVYEPFARADAIRLEELRLTTIEERVEADLALGRHHDLVPEVRRLLDEQPLRERLWGQLMLALYRCGRQTEALQAYGELRSVLLEEYGIDPSPALRRLEDDVLHQRPELQAPAAPPRAAAAVRAAPAPAAADRTPTNLPTLLTSFVGHEEDLGELEHLCTDARLVTLVGAGGVGKTRLALEVASRLLDMHPHGVFLVELAPLSDPGAIYQQVLRALGVAEDDHRGEVNALLAAVADRRILLVLDNCEQLVDACAVLVENLLAASPNVRILATSRELLRISAETVWRVPSLSTPPPNTDRDELVGFEAVRLFLDRARAVCPGWQLPAAAAEQPRRWCVPAVTAPHRRSSKHSRAWSTSQWLWQIPEPVSAGSGCSRRCASTPPSGSQRAGSRTRPPGGIWHGLGLWRRRPSRTWQEAARPSGWSASPSSMTTSAAPSAGRCTLATSRSSCRSRPTSGTSGRSAGI